MWNGASEKMECLKTGGGGPKADSVTKGGKLTFAVGAKALADLPKAAVRGDCRMAGLSTAAVRTKRQFAAVEQMSAITCV